MLNLFYDDYVDCHYEDAILVFVNHCRSEPGACNVTSIIDNLKENIFHFVTVFMNIADISEQYAYMSAIEFEGIMLQAGKDVSTLARLIIGIKHSSYKHSDRNQNKSKKHHNPYHQQNFADPDDEEWLLNLLVEADVILYFNK